MKDANDESLSPLVAIVKANKNAKAVNIAFTEILKRLDTRIKFVISAIDIPGMDDDDLYQEACIILHREAIADYNPKHDDGKTCFEAFAVMVLQRKLVSMLEKAGRKKCGPMNEAISLEDIDGRSDSDDGSDDLAADILIDDAKEIPEAVSEKDEVRRLRNKLSSQLSPIQKLVFQRYAKGWRSYKEIASDIRKQTGKRYSWQQINKSLQRMKIKAHKLYDETEHSNEQI